MRAWLCWTSFETIFAWRTWIIDLTDFNFAFFKNDSQMLLMCQSFRSFNRWIHLIRSLLISFFLSSYSSQASNDGPCIDFHVRIRIFDVLLLWWWSIGNLVWFSIAIDTSFLKGRIFLQSQSIIIIAWCSFLCTICSVWSLIEIVLFVFSLRSTFRLLKCFVGSFQETFLSNELTIV